MPHRRASSFLAWRADHYSSSPPPIPSPTRFSTHVSYTGPYCDVCMGGYYSTSSNTCVECDVYSVLVTDMTATFVTLGVAILLGAFIYFCFFSPAGRKFALRALECLHLSRLAERLGLLETAQEKIQSELVDTLKGQGDLSTEFDVDASSTSIFQSLSSIGSLVVNKVSGCLLLDSQREAGFAPFTSTVLTSIAQI